MKYGTLFLYITMILALGAFMIGGIMSEKAVAVPALAYLFGVYLGVTVKEEDQDRDENND